MHRKAWVFGFTLLLALAAASASARPKAALPDFLDARKGGIEAAHIVMPNEDIPAELLIGAEQFMDNRFEPGVRRDPAYGDSMIIGYTWYDYQHNGSIGKMIAKDRQGGVHFVWMKGFTQEAAGNRHAVYNYLQDDGTLIYQPDDADVIDNGTRSGYVCLTLLPADDRALAFYHVIAPPEHANDYLGTALGVDFDRGFGAFNSYYPNPWADIQLIWPHGAASRNNIVHILSTESPPTGADQNWQRVAYWRGTPNNSFEQWTWNDPPINVDTAGTISANLCASPTSNKVAMAWFHNRIGADQGAWADVGGYWQRNNDIRYVISNDGRNFDFQRGVRSMTKIQPVRPELAEFDLNEAYGDTFRPYCDVDLQFDPWGNENLYAVFATNGFFEEPYEDPEADGDPEPCDGATGEHDILWFWNMEEDTITMVFDGYYFNRSNASGNWRSRCGAWRMNADRGSIAFNPEEEGTIYLTWVNFPHIQDLNPDYNADPENEVPFFYSGPAQDTSASGYSGAEVMVSISTDYGITWREPVNITNTVWEGEEAPEPGQMASEAWQSVAYVADDTLHVFYVQDGDAGGVIQTPAEGSPTNSPVVYHRVPIEDLPLNDPVELHDTNGNGDFMFHNYADFRPQISDARRNVASPTPGSQVQVIAEIVGAGGHAIESAQLLYRVNGGAEQSVNMAVINGDNWGGALPGQAEGATVWYRIRAINDVNLPAVVPSLNSWYGYVVRPNGGLTIHDVQFRPEADGDRPWDNDYSFYMGYSVTVSGVVTTPAAFNSSYGGFVIQSETGQWNGIVVRGGPAVNQGDRVTVTGVVMEQDPEDRDKWEYQTYIQASNVQTTAQGQALPEPWVVENTAELTFSGGCESLEGVLVRVVNFELDDLSEMANEDRDYWPITTDGESTGYFSIIGLSNNQIDEMGIRNFRQGTRITEMTGAFTENNGYYALNLRTPADIGRVDVGDPNQPTPVRFALEPAFPNPFNAITTVRFSLSRSGFARLALYDLGGRHVADMVTGELSSGSHQFTVDASDLPTGVYMMKLEAGGRTASQKVVLMK